jgi:surface protein
MRTRSSRTNNGYVGQNHLSDDYGVISGNKNYLRTNQTQWIRPANWLPLPPMTAGDQMFAGLLAIYPPGITAGEPGSTGPSASSNFVAFSMAGCSYTVDWGNGATQSYAAGATAQYQFLYEGISASTTITDDVSLSGCRQTVITAYPTVAGTTFSGMNFGGVYSQAGYTFLSSTALSSWLDMRVAGSTINSFTLRGSRLGPRTLRQFEWVGNSAITNGKDMFAGLYNLKSFKVSPSWSANITEFQAMFSTCSSLQTVPLFDTSKGTTFGSMFSTCSSLQTVPLFNTANGTKFTLTFFGCKSLLTVPLFNTQNATTMNSMFSGCSSLQTVPLFNTQNVTDFTSMFNSCASLQTVPLFNTANGTTFFNMFNGCTSLQTVPLFNTQNVATMNSMFSGCSSLQTVPLFNTQNVASMGSMFNGCNSLQTVPKFNTGNVLSFNSTFVNCYSLQTVPLFDTSKATNIGFMLQGCSSLQTIPLFDFRLATTVTTPFDACYSLKQAATLAPSSGSWDVYSLNLSPEALNYVFLNLPTVVAGSRTCKITDNWGAPFCNRSIATGKGWLVQG